MSNLGEHLNNFYSTDAYLSKHPTLHEEDSPWKISTIIPFVDKFVENIGKRATITLLDAGAGAGIILRSITTYIEENYKLKINKFALDLSPGILRRCKKTNPDLEKALNENICNTSLADKEVTLTLMIDLLEHVPNPVRALEEVRRISEFAIIRIPLHDCLSIKVWNMITLGKHRRRMIEGAGHINAYNSKSIRCQLEKHTGQILDFRYTNVFEYFRHSEYYKDKISWGGHCRTF